MNAFEAELGTEPQTGLAAGDIVEILGRRYVVSNVRVITEPMPIGADLRAGPTSVTVTLELQPPERRSLAELIDRLTGLAERNYIYAEEGEEEALRAEILRRFGGPSS